MSRSKSSPKKSPASVPQTAETWHVVVRKLRMWILDDEKNPVRPFILLTLNLENGLLQEVQLFQAYPSIDEVLETLHKAITRPSKSTRQKAHRPEQIQFEQPDLVQPLAPALNEIGIEVTHQLLPDVIDPIIDDLQNSMQTDAPEYPGLLTVAGVKPDLVKDLFAAAADFYRAAPWVYLADIQPLALQIPKTGTVYVQLMGNAGVEYGLLIYKKWDDLLRMLAGSGSPMENIPAGGWLSFNYEEASMLSFDDLDAIEQYGWEIADKQAYPTPVKYFPDRFERPSLDELLLFELVLHAVPVFVKEYLKPDGRGDYLPVEAELSIPVRSAQVPVTAKYPAGTIPKETLPAWQDDWAEAYDEPEDDGEPGEDEWEEAIHFDRRAMEGHMADMFASAGEGIWDSALKEAQSIMYDAWEETNPARRINMAHKALFISPNCADAYVLLAEEEADTLQRALEYYQKGTKAGQQALGKDFFKENAGHFWDILETRPYMRARAGLANCLWEIGKPEEAARHYRAMLRLNPGDNQGIRYSLLHLLLELDNLNAVKKLMKQYDEDWSAVWTYTRALLSFREAGASDKAKRDLAQALEQNPFVPAYLTGKKRIPNRMPDYIGMGDENEAIDYAASNLNFWRRMPGAVDWLKSESETGSKRKRAPKKSSRRGRRSSTSS
jgi:tetratricopeptide (TPR) repeat protein